jgi:restriction system protein
MGGEALVRATRLLIAALRSEQHIDPWLRCETAQGASIAELSDLFTRADCPSRSTQFFDQRFIDFLVANIYELPSIHWRQFERLVAEYLHRQGYTVQLGPGINDDGVDIRMWPSESESGGHPLLIVQCKRQRAKVEKVVVKALWADMQAENATRGMVATTRSISPVAEATIAGRGYAIDAADQNAIAHWLEVMRSPGQGPSLV